MPTKQRPYSTPSPETTRRSFTACLTLAALCVACVAGCRTPPKPIAFRPMDGAQVQRVVAGSTVLKPDGGPGWTAPANGWWFSDAYLADMLLAEPAP